MATSIKRQYTSFAGVDFQHDESLVNLNRSPDALNIYKDYSGEGTCIETRPGYKLIGKIGNNINGIYIYNNSKALIHSETTLYLWSNFPDTPETEILKEGMNNKKSSFFMHNNKVYINDGVNYLVYDGELRNVTQDAYIPTTTIARQPSGGGSEYQDVNVLSPYRKNQFLADGTSTDYYLDAESIDEVVEVYVNDELETNYTVNLASGKITFETAPPKPDLEGVDNVVILFKKEITEYANRIQKCTISLAFDNRGFWSGNPDYPNAIFHSQLNNPAYISDLKYYQDGTEESQIKSMTVGNNILWVFKESNQNGATIFYHIPTDDDTLGKIYPSSQGNVSTGCYAKSINFNDDIVFLSKQGLEGITGDIAEEQLLTHRSSLVDNKLVNSNNYNQAELSEWNGYLLILVDKHIFLADSRQKFTGINGIEYEWYYWELGNNPKILKEYLGNLYIGAEDGKIYKLEGTNDNGQTIQSYWTTPKDAFGYSNMYKTTNKRGGIAKIKMIPNGKIKVAVKTNKKEETFITSKSLNGFNFTNIDFSNFSFLNKNENYMRYKIKEKKFIEISLKFYSDELDKPFGLHSAILEAFIGGYIKR